MQNFSGYKIKRTGQCSLALRTSSFFGADDEFAKDLLKETYKNLTLRSLSSETNSRLSDFTALTEICVEINAHIAKLFFENKEKRKSEKLA